MNKPSEHFLRMMVAAFYELPGNCVGGCLRIVLDDDNLEDHHVRWCREEAQKRNDQDAMFMCDVLMLYTEDERFEILETRGLPPYEE
ncbi:hypothetical protein BZM27_05945 [Paraburkholderia steynii]|uniref:Uncharacterized protein n=1 Tax=Paraburkholderia steynii TaxID=1245441 RepID=A0A4R0XJ25_9BURK|nr:hypothetical protein BZM27_05945 [Paraburkholderia steynii]